MPETVTLTTVEKVACDNAICCVRLDDLESVRTDLETRLARVRSEIASLELDRRSLWVSVLAGHGITPSISATITRSGDTLTVS